MQLGLELESFAPNRWSTIQEKLAVMDAACDSDMNNMPNETVPQGTINRCCH